MGVECGVSGCGVEVEWNKGRGWSGGRVEVEWKWSGGVVEVEWVWN